MVYIIMFPETERMVMNGKTEKSVQHLLSSTMERHWLQLQRNEGKQQRKEIKTDDELGRAQIQTGTFLNKNDNRV